MSLTKTEGICIGTRDRAEDFNEKAFGPRIAKCHIDWPGET